MRLENYEVEAMKAVREITAALQHIEQAMDAPKGCPAEIIETDYLDAAEAILQAGEMLDNITLTIERDIDALRRREKHDRRRTD